jgi:hypothetical protein
MRPNDTQLVQLLTELWELAPEVRFGQLLAHLEFLCEVRAGRPMAEIDDEQLLVVVASHRDELAARVNVAAEVRVPAVG